MDNSTAVERQQAAATALGAKAQAIDRIASHAMGIFEGASSFEAELQVAQSIKELRAALTDDIMRPVMELMNTDIGFLTDKDPRRKDKDGQYPKPYGVDVIRDVLIESKLRGFHTIGNEFNVISGRFYAAKAGLKRRCETWPGVSDMEGVIGLPKINGGDATVAVYARWVKDGKKCEMVAPGGKPLEVLIRVNAYMGADAVVGKAERKLYKRIFDRLSGRVTPDGDVDDVKAIENAPKPPTAPEPPELRRESNKTLAETVIEIGSEEKAEASAGLAPDTKLNNRETKPVSTQTNQPPTETKSPSVEKKSSHELLSDRLSAAGVTFDQYRRWGEKMFGAGDSSTGKLDWDSLGGFDELPDALAVISLRVSQKIISKIKEVGV